MHQNTGIVEADEEMGQRFARAVQQTPIRHGQLWGGEIDYRRPQHFDPLLIPAKPVVLLRAVNAADAAVAVDAVPGQYPVNDLFHQHVPAIRRARRRFSRHAAQALDQQDFLIRRLLSTHHAVHRGQPNIPVARQHRQLVSLLLGDALTDKAFRHQRDRVALPIIQRIHMRIRLLAHPLQSADRLTQHNAQFGA